MSWYRRRSAPVEAQQWMGTTEGYPWPAHWDTSGFRLGCRVVDASGMSRTLVVPTLSGDTLVLWQGDWLIRRDAANDWTACKPERFAEVYEAIAPAHPAESGLTDEQIRSALERGASDRALAEAVMEAVMGGRSGSYRSAAESESGGAAPEICPRCGCTELEVHGMARACRDCDLRFLPRAPASPSETARSWPESLYPEPVNGRCAKCAGELEERNYPDGCGHYYRCRACGWIHAAPGSAPGGEGSRTTNAKETP